MKNKWVVKDNFKRWWQVKVRDFFKMCSPALTPPPQMWTQFFDDMLNPKTEDRQYLPNLLQWRKRLLNLFEEVSLVPLPPFSF